MNISNGQDGKILPFLVRFPSPMDLFGVEPHRDGGEPTNVGERHRDPLALASGSAWSPSRLVAGAMEIFTIGYHPGGEPGMR